MKVAIYGYITKARGHGCLRARLVASGWPLQPYNRLLTRAARENNSRRASSATSRDRQGAEGRDNRTTAPSKTQVNPRSFHGLQCPDGPFRARRDILACLRARLVKTILVARAALRAATVRERRV